MTPPASTSSAAVTRCRPSWLQPGGPWDVLQLLANVAGSRLVPVGPERPDKPALREDKREARRKAIAQKLWGPDDSSGDPERDALTSRQVWESWATHAAGHRDAERTIYATINLSHTMARYTSGPAHESSGMDAAWVVQASSRQDGRSSTPATSIRPSGSGRTC